MLQPGDVVSVDFPGAAQTKRRPALVVSTDVYHAATPDAVLAVLTTNVAAAVLPTDYVLQDWAAAGLARPSAFRAFLATQLQSDVMRVIGKLSAADWLEVQARLRIALAVT